RTAAKRSHPDATDDPSEAEHFKDLAAAYTVLSDRRARRDYDRVRAVVAPLRVERVATRDALPRSRWTRRRAWAALLGGIIILFLGLLASAVTWSLHERDARQQARFVPVTARRVDDGRVQFMTRDGRRVVTREPKRHGDPT